MIKQKYAWAISFTALIVIIAIFASYHRGYNKGYEDASNIEGSEVTSPVEKERIDTLYITSERILHKVKYLDSIKHDTIEKVYKLNDTASVELFYQLVSE